MTTKDKVLVMMHKAAAVRSLNDKIMAKRAEYAEYAECADEPSDAYLEGFSKAAEYYGVDPAALVKEALSPAAMAEIANATRLTAKGVGQVARGAKTVANAAGRGATRLGEGLVGGMARAIPVAARNLGQFVGAVRRGLGYGTAGGRVPFGPKGPLSGSRARNPFGKATKVNGKGKPGDFAESLRKSRAEATADPTSEALGLDSRFSQYHHPLDLWYSRGQELRNFASQLGIQ